MAASGAGSKVGLGWLVLAAALAVPGFLFYNWWSHMKADRDRSVATKARGRLPDGAVFQVSPPAAKLAVPIAQPTPAATPVPVASRVPAVAAATTSVTAVVGIVFPRDPMLSPMDMVRIQEAEMAKQRARLELEEANRRRQIKHNPRKRVESPVENHIALQGTVATPGGASRAIVNNATMSLGDRFSVEGYAEKVRIVKISAAGVTFEYKKRRFRKSVSQE
ncbi:MAG: hypothetical protein AAB262_06635 [Elusimicrobiota bacterium]